MSEHNPFRAFGVVDPAIATGGTGLDFLQSMLERHEPSPPFSETTDIWMVSAETGRVVFEAMPSARFYNPMGVIHGGWIATLLDSCMGCAVQSTLKAAQTYATVEMKTVFVRAAHERTGLLRCEGTLLHSGKRIASSEGKVFDGEGRLIAYGSETCLITDLDSRVKCDERLWPRSIGLSQASAGRLVSASPSHNWRTSNAIQLFCREIDPTELRRRQQPSLG